MILCFIFPSVPGKMNMNGQNAGVFANVHVNTGITSNGLFYGSTHLFSVHLLALVGVSVFAFFGTLLLLKITDLIMPLRVSEEEESLGLDWTQHAEKL